jgi:hypothetical protein
VTDPSVGSGALFGVAAAWSIEIRKAIVAGKARGPKGLETGIRKLGPGSAARPVRDYAPLTGDYFDLGTYL